MIYEFFHERSPELVAANARGCGLNPRFKCTIKETNKSHSSPHHRKLLEGPMSPGKSSRGQKDQPATAFLIGFKDPDAESVRGPNLYSKKRLLCLLTSTGSAACNGSKSSIQLLVLTRSYQSNQFWIYRRAKENDYSSSILVLVVPS